MKRWLCVLMTVCALLLCAGALADDVCFIKDVTVDSVSTPCSYVRLKVPVEGEQQVTLTITGPGGNTVYQRDFGLRSGNFRTEDIYLKLKGDATTYEVTLEVGDTVYAFPVERVVGRIKGSAACTAGLPLEEITGAEGWRSATILRVEKGSATVPVLAGGKYEIGTATFRIKGGKLTVSVDLDSSVDGKIDSAKVYAATSALSARQLGKNKFNGLMGKLDKAIDLGDAAYVAVYVKMSVSFDPAGAAPLTETTLDDQPELWELMQQETANEAIG